MDATMNKQNEHTTKDSERARMSQINMALGVFVCFFGSVVLISICFTETFVGKMTNLGAGLIIASIGLGMIVRSRKITRNL